MIDYSENIGVLRKATFMSRENNLNRTAMEQQKLDISQTEGSSTFMVDQWSISGSSGDLPGTFWGSYGLLWADLGSIYNRSVADLWLI